MLKRKPRPPAQPAAVAVAEKPPDAWPHIDIVFLDIPADEHDETDTFFQSPVVPREGETVNLDGDFQRCGAFVVEKVEYAFRCDGRHRGWVRDLGVHVCLFVRPA